MTDKTRIWIAALVTALFLAAVSTAGVIAHHPAVSAAPAAAAPAPAKVIPTTTWHEEND